MKRRIKKLLQRVEISLIFFYKSFISPPLQLIIKGGCRYNPTCSEYAVNAIKKHGPYRGLLLAIYRFLSCNPFSKHPLEYPLK